jgi:lysine decarboxylase
MAGHPDRELLALLAQPRPAARQGGEGSLDLHLPSHGRGRGLPDGLRRLLRRPPGSWDLPELPELGGPLEPHGAVADAQRACAALLGAERCWFGVNGASGLLQAALLALAPPGSRVLLPRNLHRSLLHACVLGQLEPLLYDLPFDPGTGLWLPPTGAHLADVLAAARSHQPAAMVLVDPTYHGFRADLAALVRRLHAEGAAGIPVLVDQAHGDGSAVAAGADLVVLSCQKAGAGLAQSAVLLAQGDRVDRASLERCLLWLQTSSPSALLLASCAASLAHGRSRAGLDQKERAVRRAERMRARLAGLGFDLVPTGDPLRLVLATGPLGIHGSEVDGWLLERGVVAELAEPGALTFCLGLQPPRSLERRLPRCLEALRRQWGGPPLPPFAKPPLPLMARTTLAPGRAWRAASEPVPLAQAVDRIAAEPLCPYPPGIPLLIPGERLDRPRVAWLEEQRRRWPSQIADSVQVLVEAQEGVEPSADDASLPT